MYVRLTSGLNTSVHPVGCLRWDVFWMFRKNFQNHRTRSLRSCDELYTTQDQSTTGQTGIHKNSEPASHVSLAVLNSYVAFPKEVIVGVEVLQQIFKN